MPDPSAHNPVDRRKHTRHEIAEKAEIYFELERKISVDIVDLSFEGLCIEAGSDAITHMLPVIDSLAGYDKVPLRLSFEVIKLDRRSEINVLVSTAHLKSMANGLTQIGLEIVDVELGVLELSDYIAGLEGA